MVEVTIYEIECRKTGMKYVGSTKGPIQKRMREHRCLLNAGSHTCGRMLADWQAYGSDSFWIYPAIQRPMTLSERRALEEERMEFWEKHGLLYNEHKISMRPTEEARKKGVKNSHLRAGLRWTPEANLKRSMAQKGKPKGHGAKISATKRAKRGDEIVSSCAKNEAQGFG